MWRRFKCRLLGGHDFFTPTVAKFAPFCIHCGYELAAFARERDAKLIADHASAVEHAWREQIAGDLDEAEKRGEVRGEVRGVLKADEGIAGLRAQVARLREMLDASYHRLCAYEDGDDNKGLRYALSATADNAARLAQWDFQREVELLKLVTQHCNVDQVQAIADGLLAARSKPVADLITERQCIAEEAADEATARERERCVKRLLELSGRRDPSDLKRSHVISGIYQAAAEAISNTVEASGSAAIRTPDAGEGGK